MKEVRDMTTLEIACNADYGGGIERATKSAEFWRETLSLEDVLDMTRQSYLRESINPLDVIDSYYKGKDFYDQNRNR